MKNMFKNINKNIRIIRNKCWQVIGTMNCQCCAESRSLSHDHIQVYYLAEHDFHFTTTNCAYHLIPGHIFQYYLKTNEALTRLMWLLQLLHHTSIEFQTVPNSTLHPDYFKSQFQLDECATCPQYKYFTEYL